MKPTKSAHTSEPAPVEKSRKDYAPTPYTISEVELDFNLGDGATDDERAKSGRHWSTQMSAHRVAHRLLRS